jgi:transcriptional regulator with XRE-family HTH domain
MQFGIRLRALRKSNNMLQRQLAAHLDIDTPMYSKLERGERKAKRDQVIKIAKFLQVNQDELLTAWLADQLYELVKNEELAINAVEIVQHNLQKLKKGKTHDEA